MELRRVLAPSSSKTPWKISQVLKDYCEGFEKLDRISRKDEGYLKDSYKDYSISRVLLALYLGFDANCHDSDMPLQWTAVEGHTRACKILLECSTFTSSRLDNALILASEHGHAGVCALLLYHGARDEINYALRWAAFNGHADVCKLLLDHGADVHACNDMALRWAAYSEHVDVCALLLYHGADVHAALRWAKKNEHKDVCKLLKKYMNK